MELFVRSADGLANVHLFYEEEFIVYCESDPDKPERVAWDIGFWDKILSRFNPDIKFTFKPQGGKLAVLEIANRLELSNGHRSICVVDKDYSDIHKEQTPPPFTILTYGYAFENDMCDQDVLAEAINIALPGKSSLNDISALLNKNLSSLKAELRWLVLADQLLSIYYQSFFERDSEKFRRCFDEKGACKIPKLNRERAMERLRHARSQINKGRAISHPAIDRDTLKMTFGHLTWWLHFRICCKIMRDLGAKKSVTEDIFAGLVLSMFYHKLDQENWHIHEHYADRVLSALKAAA